MDILKGINSNCIDLIYLDPPFNKKKIFTAPIGSSADGAKFSDIFREEDIKNEWVSEIKAVNKNMSEYLQSVSTFGNKYNYCYLVYMAIRLLQCHRILKDTGSIYLHCDPTMSHYLKLLMDMIFDEKNFRNEIIWSYKRWTASKKKMPFLHDIILCYGKGENTVFNPITVSNDNPNASQYVSAKNKDGKTIVKRDKDGNPIKRKLSSELTVGDVWDIPIISPNGKERTGYPTQKPIALLGRIIEASSNEGDMVLDPFCGCATTCVAAECLNRKWIGIDVSIKAYELVKERLEKATEQGELLFGESKIPDIFHKTDAPKRTDTGNEFDDKQGWVYIIENEKFDDIKVGITKDIDKRLRAYQTNDPDRGYKVVFDFQSPKYIEIENRLKEKFARKNEWYRKEDIDDIKNVIEEFAN